MKYQGVYIPLLPESLKEFLQAPVPFLIGTVSKDLLSVNKEVYYYLLKKIKNFQNFKEINLKNKKYIIIFIIIEKSVIY